nr:replication factor C subunit 3-like [Tanacetum cinerariifolium]
MELYEFYGWGGKLANPKHHCFSWGCRNYEIVEVLEFVARKEEIELPRELAERIVVKSKNNMRQAIRSSHSWMGTIILTGCENDIADMALNIVEMQSPKQLYDIRQKLQNHIDHSVPLEFIFEESTLFWQFVRVVHCTSGLSFLTAGKENGVNIHKSIDEGLFQMGTFRETLAEGEEDGFHLGPERPRVYSDLSPKDKKRYNADIRATKILLQGLPKDIYTLINHYTDAKDIWDNVKMLLKGFELTKDRESQLFVTAVKLNRGLKKSNYDQLYAYLKQHEGRHNRGRVNNARGSGVVGNGGAQNRVGNVNSGQARQIKCYNCNVQENGIVLDEEQLLFVVGGQDNAVDEDVDEPPAPTAQTMFMENLSSIDLVYDEAGPSYDSNILSEVHDHDNYQDAVCELHKVHEMHDNVQPNCVVNSYADYTSDSNMILYDQFPKMHDAHIVVQARCLELKAKLSKFNANIQHDDHNELVKRFSNLEVKNKQENDKIETKPDNNGKRGEAGKSQKQLQ